MMTLLVHPLKHLAVVLTMIGLLLPLSASADMPFPTINEPEDESLKCVQPEHEMVRNHMNYILHQRDDTVHEGIRTEKYSLAQCIDCHAQPDKNGDIARIDSKEHFCNGCHEYASVTIDCFECHADRPQEYIKRAKKPAPAHVPEQQSLKQQLQQLLLADKSTETTENAIADKKAEVRN